MAKNAVTDWSTTAASNTDVGGINIDEGMLPSGVNNAMREIMEQIATFVAGLTASGSLQVVRSAGGRLTLTTAVPVTTTDVTAASTLYYTPHKDNIIWLYTASAWKVYVFTEVSLALSGLTSGKPYDVFLYDNSSVLTLELLVWTNDTTRATALVRQDGVLCKTGALTRRYLGTIYTTSTTTTEDSKAKRYVWNVDHRVARPMRNAIETTDSWTYTTATIRQANANTANQLDMVRGLDEDAVEATVTAQASNIGTAAGMVAVGLDSTSALSADCFNEMVGFSVIGQRMPMSATYRGFPGVGRHYLAWLEYSTAAGTTTWSGDDTTPTLSQSGINGMYLA